MEQGLFNRFLVIQSKFISNELCYHHLKTQQMCTVHGIFERQEQSPSTEFVFSLYPSCSPEFAECFGEFDRCDISTIHVWFIINMKSITEKHLPCIVKSSYKMLP